MRVPLPNNKDIKVSLLVVLLVPAKVCFAMEAELLPVEVFPSVVGTLANGGRGGSDLSAFRALVISATAEINVNGLINIITTVSIKNTNTIF